MTYGLSRKRASLVVDPRDRSIRAVNETFEQIFGWTAGELEEVDYREIVEPADHLAARDLITKVCFGGDPSPKTVRVLDRGGEDRETRWVGIPNLVDRRGQAVAVICRPAPRRPE